MPASFGTDRWMHSTDNLELCLSAGIKKIAIQPKGKAEPLVSRRDHRELSNRRVEEFQQISGQRQISALERRALIDKTTFKP